VCVSGHQDWVFGIQFIAPDVVASCSRDSSVLLWRLDHNNDHFDSTTSSPTYQPVSALRKHEQKVRALKHNPNKSLLASLGGDRSLVFWDTHSGDVISEHVPRDVEDLVCLAVDCKLNLFACGGRDYISLIDPRMDQCVLDIESPDENFGVRSVCLRSKILSMGGGLGRLAFFDLVAGKFCDCYSKEYQASLQEQAGDREWIRHQNRQQQRGEEHEQELLRREQALLLQQQQQAEAQGQHQVVLDQQRRLRHISRELLHLQQQPQERQMELDARPRFSRAAMLYHTLGPGHLTHQHFAGKIE
jgi:WD40 repeat protein